MLNETASAVAEAQARAWATELGHEIEEMRVTLEDIDDIAATIRCDIRVKDNIANVVATKVAVPDE